MKMIQTKIIKTVLNRGINWNTICVLFLSQLFLFESIYADYLLYIPIQQKNGLVLLMYQLSDRYVILLGSGIGLVILFLNVFSVLDNNYIRIRMENDLRICILVEKLILIISLFFLVGQVILGLLIGLIGWNPLFIFEENLSVTIKLCINLFFFYLTLGNISFTMYELIKKRIVVSLILVCFLIVNLTISNNINFYNSKCGQLSWIGNVMVIHQEEYSINIGYWFLQNLFLGIFWIIKNSGMLETRYVKYNQIIKKCVLGFGSILIIFLIFGMASKGYLSVDNSALGIMLESYYVGYDKIGGHLFWYLFYQLPIWIFSYNYLTRCFSFYGVQYLIRLGSINNLIIRMIYKLFLYVGCYYIIGTAVLIILHFSYIVRWQISDVILIVFIIINMILQTVLIAILSFFLGLLEASPQNIGFILVIILHMVAVPICIKNELIGVVCPIVQGVYMINNSHQMFSMFYQWGWCTIITVAVLQYLKYFQNDAITRKMKRM